SSARQATRTGRASTRGRKVSCCRSCERQLPVSSCRLLSLPKHFHPERRAKRAGEGAKTLCLNGTLSPTLDPAKEKNNVLEFLERYISAGLLRGKTAQTSRARWCAKLKSEIPKSAKRRQWFARVCALVLALVLTFGWPAQSAAYAVLAHEAIIDSVWDTNIRPLLLKRFPDATEEELKEAHGYAYGGAIIQDMGYYPHGSHFFSDLTHYVRSGDFVLALLHDGHLMATNRAVPLLYPKLKTKYGDRVTYEQDPLAHVKTEFGFDVLEVAQ